MGFWACITLCETGIAQTKASIHIAHWVPIPAISFSFHGPAGHVGPLGPLPLSLGFLSPLISFLSLILPMGLLTVIPVMLAHWACYLFLRLPRHACFIFTSYPSHGPVGCHSCHSNPSSLLPLFLDFPDPVTSSLLLILPIGLLVVISAMLAIGFTNLLLPFLFLFHSISLIVGLLLLLDLS